MRSIAPSAPFEPVSIIGESVTVETKGKILVLPTGNPDILPTLNEYTLNGRALQENGAYLLTNELEYLIKPWIVLYDPAKTEIDFFLFTYKPTKLGYIISDVPIDIGQFQTADGVNYTTADDIDFFVKITDNYITSLILYPGNGSIYHGQITHNNPSLDSDSDLVPDIFGKAPYHFVTQDGNYFTTADNAYFDVLSIADGSITKLLEAYGMVI